jgi:DNA-binding NtrC family response regulator
MKAPETNAYRRHDVPAETIQKWQKTVDLMAQIFDVPAGLIMRVLPSQIEVLLASNSPENPYEPGEKADLGTGLYCETVMAERKPLSVPNALDDPNWAANPDVKLNMISYTGLPLICPDGSVFGTICVLDDHTRTYLPLYTDMLGEFRGIIEQDLRMLEQQSQLHTTNKRLSHELAVARELSDAADHQHKLWLQGTSIAVRALRESVEAYAGNDIPVLLTGANGAGQEAVARAIHRKSSRSNRPFIFVACPHVSAADETVFGMHTAGTEETSFAKLALADGGTLYLEGIETLCATAQREFLRILQDAASKRAAGQQPTPNVRIITSTSTDLAEAARRGDFNSELINLLGQRRLAVPSLAERRDDVVLLANCIVAARSRVLGKTFDGLSDSSEEMLVRYRWPGNLEELQSVVERAVVLSSGTRVDVPEDLLREGRRVGSYTLQSPLGTGSMGEVWLGKHAMLARPSAVKLIRQEALRGDSQARELLEQKFRREALATSQLRSPHTVELYDFGVTDSGDFYYVMEYLNGVDLQSLVANFGPVSPARAIFFLGQACMSLAEAHQAGLVHRDVKPANLFACCLGPHYDFLKLLDFGIVRNSAGVDQTVTPSKQWQGTPATLSPEAAKCEDVTFASDIYGLGCVAYWLLTGRQVFQGPTSTAVIMQHITKIPRPPSDHRSEIPEALDKLVMKCLAKDPQDRPGDTLELRQLLSAIACDEPWDNLQAELWWKTNMPSIGEAATADDQTITLDPLATERPTPEELETAVQSRPRQ